MKKVVKKVVKANIAIQAGKYKKPKLEDFKVPPKEVKKILGFKTKQNGGKKETDDEI